MKTLNCIQCRTRFEAIKRTARFCKKCRVLRDKERSAAWAIRNRELVSQRARQAYKENPERFLAAAKRYQVSHPEKIKRDNRYYLLRRYGLSFEDYNAMVKVQNGRCYICKAATDKLYVDHCHKTGKTRALLCSSCNAGLGGFRDSVEILTSAIEYIKVMTTA